jgi:amino acid efflux transporter
MAVIYRILALLPGQPGWFLSYDRYVPISRTTPAKTVKRHKVSYAEGVALYLGAVLGTGVLGLPALAARTAGPASLLAWAAVALVSAPLAATFAALAARYPDAGGVSTFARRAFGRRAAAVTGWWFYIGVPLGGVPAGALFAGAYVAAATGGGRVTAVLVGGALFLVAIGANLVGLRLSARLQLALSGLLAALLVVAVAVSAPAARAANLHPFAPHGLGAIGSAALLIVWSFTGWEAVTHLAGEFASPGRDIRRATVTAVITVAVLYLALATVTILVLGPTAERTDAPLALLLGRAFGSSATTLAAVVALVVTLGTMNTFLASLAKLGAALGRDGALPGWLAHGSQTGEAPRRSLLAVGGISSAGLVVIGLAGISARPAVLLATSCFVGVYGMAAGAGIRLLPPGVTRGAAVVSLLLALLLAWTAGWYLTWPVLLAIGAICFAPPDAATAHPPA